MLKAIKFYSMLLGESMYGYTLKVANLEVDLQMYWIKNDIIFGIVQNIIL